MHKRGHRGDRSFGGTHGTIGGIGSIRPMSVIDNRARESIRENVRNPGEIVHRRRV